MSVSKVTSALICTLAFLQSAYLVAGFFHFSNLIVSNSRQYAVIAPEISRDIVKVDLGDRSYSIYIDQGLMNDQNLFKTYTKCKKVLIVTNDLVGPIYKEKLKQTLQANPNLDIYEVILPDGEEYKNMEMLIKILDAAMEHRLDRKSIFLALGGGVIGDITGFAASIFQRGVRFVQIPTTLMAMVDSAVGGKTAVNHPLGKNMIGAFHQPEAVIADISALSSLPDREFFSGIPEVIKYGLIYDPEFFNWLEANLDQVLTRDPKALKYIIRKSCEVKAKIVAMDEKEGDKGIRALLNLGHTFGHAIEAGSGYGTWLHGEAVATGTVMAAKFSNRLGLIDKQLTDRIERLMIRGNMPVNVHNPHVMQKVDITTEQFLSLMAGDKKVSDGKLSLILLKGELGKAVLTEEYDRAMLQELVSEFCNI